MTKPAALAAADATVLWMALRRHQVVGALMVVGSFTTWLVTSGSGRGWLVVAAGSALVAAPAVPGDTVGSFGVRVVRYALRPKWSSLQIRHGDDLLLARRGRVQCTLASLTHRGRLDLVGGDRMVHDQLRELTTALATSAGGHVSLHVTTSASETTTVVAAPREFAQPGWVPTRVVPILSAGQGRRLVREQWGAVRTTGGVVTTVRVATFSASGDRPLLAALQLSGLHSVVSVHAEIVSAPSARRITGRAVHRVGVDDVASRSMGFRRSAHGDVMLTRLREREQLVASGEALLRLAVYLTVTSENIRDARHSLALLRQRLRDVGVTIDRGRGQQAQWFRWSLPGGLEW